MAMDGIIRVSLQTKGAKLDAELYGTLTAGGVFTKVGTASYTCSGKQEAAIVDVVKGLATWLAETHVTDRVDFVSVTLARHTP
jgi:hypothetical protein